jgi:hypothetical protein
VQILDVIEMLGRLPAECWLVPPVIILAVIFGLGMLQRQMHISNWQTIAARTGLTVHAGWITNSPQIRGHYRGRSLIMTTVSNRSNSVSWTWTRVTLEIDNPHYISLTLLKQGFFETLTGKLWKDVTIGDAAFDRAFVVQSNEPDEARAVLGGDANLQYALVQANLSSVRISGGRLECDYDKREKDPAHAELVLNALSDLADRVAKYEP